MTATFSFAIPLSLHATLDNVQNNNNNNADNAINDLQEVQTQSEYDSQADAVDQAVADRVARLAALDQQSLELKREMSLSV